MIKHAPTVRLGFLAAVVPLAAACGGSSSSAVQAGSTAISTPTSSPAASSPSPPSATTSTTGAPAAAKPTCPLREAQVNHAFGQTLAGPKPPLNAYDVCVFGRAKPGNYHVVGVDIYTASTLAGLGSSAASYLHSNRQPGAVTVSGVGSAGYIQGDSIWIETRDHALLNISADFVVTSAQLEAAARAAVPKV